MKYVIELPEYIKHEVDIEEDVDKAEDFIKWYSATLTRAIKDSTPLQLQAEFDLDKMTDRVAEKALDEFTYNGKTIREWVELMVTVESVVEVRMVEEFERIKAEIDKLEMFYLYSNDDLISKKEVFEIIDTRIAELKGE